MKKLAACAWLGAISLAALTLFQMKHEVKSLEQALAQEHRAILGHQEAIHVLKGEWSYLNRPARIAELAKQYLFLEQLGADHIVQIGDIPLREPAIAESDDPTLDAILASMRKRQ